MQKEAKKLFLKFLKFSISSKRYKNIAVYHFWADKADKTDEVGSKNVSGDFRNKGFGAWCSCPTCRAFTPEEQNRIAVNTVADVLYSVQPDAYISFYESFYEPFYEASSEKSNIIMRRNVFKVSRLPETSGVEAGGWFLAT